MESIRIFFICSDKYSDENESSETMLQAYEVCKQNVSTNVSWVKESDFKILNLNKTDFIVFEQFEGKLFEELQNTKSARIVGPWAVSICLMEGKPIPNYDWPIYNVAMYNCIVTCSHMSKIAKMSIKNKIEQMGGCYTDSLVEKNTHLVTGSAKSEKYLVAAEAGIKLMCPPWIDDVWNVSQSVNVHADDEQFKTHTCLPFHNLTISSTGITNTAEKHKIEKIIKDNGGNFSGKLTLATTDILICSGDVTRSEKFKAARQCPHIKCVNINWVTDSVQKGYALPHTLYQVQKITSTPTKTDKYVNPEFSILSAIGGPNLSQKTCVEDTLSLTSLDVEKTGNSKRKVQACYDDLVKNLDIKKAKKAGQFLDGYSVYLIGFNPEHVEKLNKIINLSGATRYDMFSDRVTHIIVGDVSSHEVSIIKNKNSSAHLVSIQWLIDSIDDQNPQNEDKYLIVTTDLENSHLGSPLSKKGLSLLRSNRTVTEKEINAINAEEEMENELTLQKIPTQNTSDTLGRLLDGVDNTNLIKEVLDLPKSTPQFEPSKTSTQQSSLSITQDAESEMNRIFENLKFLIVGFEEEEFVELRQSIIDLGGDVVSKTYKGIPDYAIVPIFNKNQLHHTASEVVNDLFIGDCIRNEELILTISYYHRPFDISDAKPLENCVITISSYSGTERIFLRNLIEALGGIAQEQFARVRSERKELYPSTHLVSSEANGKKYAAALKWDLPVVNKDWLLECAKTGKKVYEGDFLLGESSAPDIVENTPQKMKTITESLKTVSTPTDIAGSSKQQKVLTPVNDITPYHKRFLNSAEKFSQVTPVNKIMKQFRESNLNESRNAKETKEYNLPPPWTFVKTPETPLGAFLTPNPSPGLRKQWEYWLEQFPDKSSPKSNKSTPLSEIKRQLAAKVSKIGTYKLNFEEGGEQSQENVENTDTELDPEISVSEADKTPDNQELASRLQQLEDMLSASGRRPSRNFQNTITAPAAPESMNSQPCTVGWDFRSQEYNQPTVVSKIFSLSGITDDIERARMVNQLEQLGGTVSSLANYDPSCTHLLCPKPARNEKSLSCMAAGKYILHISYLEHSLKAKRFLNEEEFEFGNPKSMGKFSIPHDKDTETRMQRMHWWRKEVARRGYGAFNDMRAIVVAIKRDPIVRVIEAGGGVVVDIKPPFEDTIYATHCLIEQRSVENFSDYIPLAKQGIYLVNTVYISDHLHNPNKDIRDCILPYFSKYYSRN
ncbi:DNA topoisomerase 2-binding protein 1-B isoform X1 [Diorhabda carinulata]|uniref:DNA topoisomerase 2-binding protein 1-B isoform X1 n=1 Tax=Diorhabda carinulata TaxID=1163345 RepID=UPI0025A06018|nr:DNA topoisomerase 2-binding protein 1-B isoform X1 [Diorhabda carinulata]XP_057665917.1 DNA topoisomerase 2-binding protein 1-B isoform X1 [Diorhabda carinulata]